VGESTGTGSGGDVRAGAAATASDRCTGSGGRPGVGGGAAVDRCTGSVGARTAAAARTKTND